MRKVGGLPEGALLQKICDVIVNTGGYRLAWIGLTENDTCIRPVAGAGYEEGYLEKLGLVKISIEDISPLYAIAAATRSPQVARHIATDERYMALRDEALKRGYASSASIPMIFDGRPMGVINIYSDRPDDFDRLDVELLSDLAQDVIYGIMADRFRAEREAAEIRLRTSETNLKIILNSINEAIFIHDAGGNIIDVNDKMLKMYGVDKEEATKLSIVDDYSGPNNPFENLAERWDRVIAGEPQIFEWEARRPKDGSTFSVEVFLNSVRLEDRDVILATVRDISLRKRAEAALVESERRFRGTFEQAAVGMAHLKLDGTFIRLNHRFCDIIGYPYDEALRLTFRDITHPEDLEQNIEGIRDLLHGKAQIYSMEKRYIRKDMSIVWVNLTVSLLRDPSGNPEYFISVIEDISRRKRAEEEREQLLIQLREVNRDLSSLTRVTTTAISTLNLDELLNKLLKSLINVMDADAAVILLKEGDRLKARASLGFDEKVHVHYTVRMAQGFAGTVAATMAPLYIEDVQKDPRVMPILKDSGVKSILGVPMQRDSELVGVLHVDWFNIHPMNERELNLLKIAADRCALAILNSRLFEETRDLRDQAELYVDIMSHDINNMNQAGTGYLEIALATLDLSDEEKVLLQKPLESLRNSSALINTVTKLQMARAGPMKVHPVNAGKMLEEVIGSYSNVPDRDVTINVEICRECLVPANDLLKDVFRNLVENAIKHSSGPLTINARIEPAVIEDMDYYRIMIEDTGPGIPDELKSVLFHRLVRGKTGATGRGIGLYLVRTLVERFGGRVYVEDRVKGDYSKGSRFVILLPAYGP